MAVLTPQPKMQFTTAAGVPLSGGKVYTYTAGTTTPQATYTDYTGATPNANPVILDSRGEANIWLGGALYKFRLTDANDVEIWTVDYISAPTSAVSPVLSGNVTIDSDTPTPALKITQTGTGPVMRVQDAADPDVTPFIVDASGNVGVGTSSPSAKLEVSDGTVRVVTSPVSTIGYFGTNSNHPLGFIANNAEGMRLDASGNLFVNSGYGSIAIAYGCRAWVNFNGTGVVAIRASRNVSSITDIFLGTYTVNFTTALPDANYATVCTGGVTASSGAVVISSHTATVYTTSFVSIQTRDAGGSLADLSLVNVVAFR